MWQNHSKNFVTAFIVVVALLVHITYYLILSENGGQLSFEIDPIGVLQLAVTIWIGWYLAVKIENKRVVQSVYIEALDDLKRKLDDLNTSISTPTKPPVQDIVYRLHFIGLSYKRFTGIIEDRDSNKTLTKKVFNSILRLRSSLTSANTIGMKEIRESKKHFHDLEETIFYIKLEFAKH